MRVGDEDRRAPILDSVRCAIATRVGELNGLELAMVAATLHGDSIPGKDALLVGVAARALELLARDELPPDAVVQVADCLATGAAGTAGVPALLAEASDHQRALALGALRSLSAVGPLSGKTQHLKALGLTTLGAHGTVQLLSMLGLQSDAARSGPVLKAWPGPMEHGPQVRCLLQYHLLLSTRCAGGGAPGSSPEHVHKVVAESERILVSGGTPEAEGTGPGLEAVPLRFPRDRDAEFLALTAVVAAVRREVAEMGANNCNVHGTVMLHASHTPCLSCVGAMVQFRNMFPTVRLAVSFDARPPLALGRGGQGFDELRAV